MDCKDFIVVMTLCSNGYNMRLHNCILCSFVTVLNLGKPG